MPRLAASLIMLGLMPALWTLYAAAALARPGATDVARQVDQQLAEELFTADTQLAPRVDDTTFLRRAWLDLVGDIPSPEHVTAFLLDPAADKRERVVRQLLDHPQFGQNWARYWRDVILYRQLSYPGDKLADALVVRLTEELNANTPWNAIATEFLTAAGDVQNQPAATLIVAQQGRTEEIAAEVSRIFLGVQIQCAQCHDHPYDRWQREQFHELAAFFPRVGLRPLLAPTYRSFLVTQNDRPDPSQKLKERFELRKGAPEHYMPDLEDPAARGTRMQPKFFLTGAELPLGTPDAQRRAQLAQWMTESPWFAKAYVNRLWSELVGGGFYEPIDDLGPDRMPVAPQTIELLTRHFVDSGYDVKWLFRTIMATDAYQRQCRPRTSANTPFTANVAQPLRSDQLYNAILTALAVDEADRPLLDKKSNRKPKAPPSARKQYTAAFGYDPSNPRESITSSIPQALAMMNMWQLNQAIVRPGSDGLLPRLLEEIPDDRSLVEELYLRTLSREPSDKEIDKSLAYRQTAPGRRAAFEDLLWALLNSAEFSHRR